VINEIAQWVVLVFLAVFTVGLTRQLGHSMIRSRQDRADAQGPDLNQKIPRSVVTADEWATLAELMAQRGAEVAVLLAVDERCPGCAQLITAAEEHGVPTGLPVMAISRSDNVDFVTRLSSTFDLVSTGTVRFKGADLVTTPYVMLLDTEGRVVHKAAGMLLHPVIDEWFGRQPALVHAAAEGEKP
jgi:hypothetical protein